MKATRKFLEKKFLIITGIVAVVITTSIVGGIILSQPKPNLVYLNVNGAWGPLKLDPIEAREPPCVWVISQVAEGLFDYNHISCEIVPLLATSYSWSSNKLRCTITLRQGVRFHDGTNFNAQAVKWNFDRLYTMIDQAPHLIPEARLWQLSDGTPIISEIQIINDYSVRFILNEPYAPFLGLLTTWSAFIISPSSTPVASLLDISSDDLIGTGPFIYDTFIEDSEVRLTANPNYWDGKPAFDKLIFKVFGHFITHQEAYENIESINQSLYSGDLHLASKIQRYDILGNYSDFVDRIQNEPSLVLDENPLKTTYNFIGINNNLINVSWRKALSYAFDYDYFLDILLDGWADRMKSPIPEGILYSNTKDFDIPTLNLTIARQTLVNDPGINTTGLPLDNNEPWEDLVDNNKALANFTFTYDEGNSFRIALLNLLKDNFKKIGIKIIGNSIPYIQFIYIAYELEGYHRDMLDLYHMGWNADFSDPYNYINHLMSNESADNFSQINDHDIQIWMDEALGELNSTIREEYYYDIQQRCIEEIYPWIMLDIPKIVSIQSATIKNYYPTSMQWKLTVKTISFT
ncbi:MAG: ABC transporter substrate-binding protein [Promethearchaeota archaeon]|jgi:peptide/nickel transport system substrate-binding protein